MRCRARAKDAADLERRQQRLDGIRFRPLPRDAGTQEPEFDEDDGEWDSDPAIDELHDKMDVVMGMMIELGRGQLELMQAVKVLLEEAE